MAVALPPIVAPIIEVDIESIVVERDARQRRQLDPASIATLAADIARHGLLNPIILDEDHELIAGERRLAAMRQLGWTKVPVRFWHLLDPRTRHRLEWAENVHREDLSWPDRARAVANFHACAAADAPTWTLQNTADELGLSKSWVSRQLMVVAAAEQNPSLWLLASATQAYGAIERRFGRELGVILAEALDLDGLEPDGVELEPAPTTSDGEIVWEKETPPTNFTTNFPYQHSDSDETVPVTAGLGQTNSKPKAVLSARWAIHCDDFVDWASAYSGPPFTVLHLDPPYGIGFSNTGIFRKRNALDTIYDDKATDYERCMTTLATHQQKLIAPGAHIICWYSADRYTQVVNDWQTLFAQRAPFILPTPLIWHKSNNRGMMTDARRRPRHVYETALLITFGDQKLARPIGTDLVNEPADPDLHPSAKPLAVVRTWLAGVVDTTTRLLDPTCGHGSAIIAALELGAREAIGIELDPTHAARAKVEIATRARELQAMETVVL